MPDTVDPNASGNPNPGAEQDASPGEGEPGAPAEKPSGQTVAQVAERNLQGLVDQNLTHLDKGEFGKMNPKVVQLLTKYHEMMTGSQEKDPQTEPFRPAASGYAQPQDTDPNAADAALGRETRSKQMLGEIHETVAQNFMAEEWAEDVKAFMALVGDKEITDEVWATVDFTDPRKFPRTRQGYRTWKTNAMKATAQLLGGAPEKAADPSAVDADRAAAGQTNRPPAPKGGTGTGFKNAVEVARAFRSGKINKAQAKEELAKFRTVH